VLENTCRSMSETTKTENRKQDFFPIIGNLTGRWFLDLAAVNISV